MEIILYPDVAGLTYCTPDGAPLEMDLYFPVDKHAPWQVLIYTHGGSLTSGDKRKRSGVIDITAVTARGYAVAAIDYRLIPANPFPAEVLGEKCAIRFLRAHAVEYQLDTRKSASGGQRRWTSHRHGGFDQ